ncbi:MAG: biliverdin-producing heme oxygenase [Gammaproteobacteria bacterium]
MNRSTTHTLLAAAVESRHRALDQHASLRALLATDVCLDDYVHALRLLRDCFALLEPGLAAYEQSGCPYKLKPWSPRLPAINADLRALGVQPPGSDCHIGPVVPDMPGSYLGVRYVLEGSTQGGVYIAAHLAEKLPIVKQNAFRYWSLQEQGATNWPAFLKVVAGLDGDDTARQQALQAAIQTFDIFLAVFHRVEA